MTFERRVCNVCGANLVDDRCPECGERTLLASLPHEFGENPLVTGAIAVVILVLLFLLGLAFATVA